ncbi:hypothetical protein [Paenibacillus turpanensis]|uniref:hypothetical protein n=1 Tax=Paenibacillus turpanensis TaxID=2689078 RepID=UPI0014075103|nr:hypothetical protein [Paenibacillus turpanensis]
MGRYFYYLVILNMLVNVFAYVPSLLLEHRYEGSVAAIPIGALLGSLLMFVFVWSMNKFQGMTLPEILKIQLPRRLAWLRHPLLVYVSVMWFFAGLLTLLAFNDVTYRYINPEVSELQSMAAFLIFLAFLLWILSTEKLLYLLEIILLLNVPFIFIILYQAIHSEYLSWHSITEVATHIVDVPNMAAVAAATFVFSGYTNLIVYHRVFSQKISLKRMSILPFLGMANLLTTFFIPIGMHGADGVFDYTFPWVATADSLRIELGPIERIIALFLLLYVGISLTSVAIHWHIAVVVLGNLLSGSKNHGEAAPAAKRWIIGGFTAASLYIGSLFNEKHIFTLGEVWLRLRLPSELFLVTIVFLLARRKRNNHAPEDAPNV